MVAKPGRRSPDYNDVVCTDVKQFTSMSSGVTKHYFDALYAAIRGLELVQINKRGFENV
jgi:hypothetical protein